MKPRQGTLFLFHGAGGDSRYLGRLAKFLAQKSRWRVVTPDWRGHGPKALEQNFVDLSEFQLLADVESLILHWRQRGDLGDLILAGHSLGGGFVLKESQSPRISGVLAHWALAPFWGLHQIADGRAFVQERDEIVIRWAEKVNESLGGQNPVGRLRTRYPIEFFKACSVALENGELIPTSLTEGTHLSLADQENLLTNRLDHWDESGDRARQRIAVHRVATSHFGIAMDPQIFPRHLEVLNAK